MKLINSSLISVVLAVLTVTTVEPAVGRVEASVASTVPTTENKATIYGNFGSATANCVVTGDKLDVDITLTSVRGKITYMAGTVSTDAGHVKAFTHSPNVSKYTVEDSVQLSLVGVDSGNYTANVYGSGTTTQGVFFFTTYCTFQ